MDGFHLDLLASCSGLASIAGCLKKKYSKLVIANFDTDTPSSLSDHHFVTNYHLWSARRGYQGSGYCRGSLVRSPGCCTAGNHPGIGPANLICHRGTKGVPWHARGTMGVRAVNPPFILIRMLSLIEYESNLSSTRS